MSDETFRKIRIRVAFEAEVVEGTGDVLCVHQALDDSESFVITHAPTGFRIFARGFLTKGHARRTAKEFFDQLTQEQQQAWESDDLEVVRSTRPVKPLQDAAENAPFRLEVGELDDPEIVPLRGTPCQ